MNENGKQLIYLYVQNKLRINLLHKPQYKYIFENISGHESAINYIIINNNIYPNTGCENFWLCERMNHGLMLARL